MKASLGFLFAFGFSVCFAGTLHLSPGEDVVVNSNQSTRVVCEGSGISPSKPICQQGHTVCIGLNPGDLCDVGSGIRSYCVKTRHDIAWGQHSCDCKAER